MEAVVPTRCHQWPSGLPFDVRLTALADPEHIWQALYVAPALQMAYRPMQPWPHSGAKPT
jgi:hypothetical protein